MGAAVADAGCDRPAGGAVERTGDGVEVAQALVARSARIADLAATVAR